MTRNELNNVLESLDTTNLDVLVDALNYCRANDIPDEESEIACELDDRGEYREC